MAKNSAPAIPRIYIGTSGWHYRHWVGSFYPSGTRSADFLGRYIRHFRTVEINNSFYRLPSPDTLAAWRDAVPRDFRFAVKASRFITHNKKLKDSEGSFRLFFDRVKVLGPGTPSSSATMTGSGRNAMPCWKSIRRRFASMIGTASRRRGW